MAKILVADDDESLLQSIKRLLEYAGHEVVAAQDGTEALRLLQEQTFDLVLSDNNMPEISGLELLRTLRDGGNLVPFILNSGIEGPELTDACETYRATFLLKPAYGLVGTIEQALALQRL